MSTLYDVELSWKDNEKNSMPHYSGIGTGQDSIISHVFNFYTFLKFHPLVLRHQIYENDDNFNGDGLNSNQKVKTATSYTLTGLESTMTAIERRLHFIAAYFHLINGCPLISLDVLSRLPKYISFSDPIKEIETKKPIDKEPETVSEPKMEDKADAFDWGFGSSVAKKRRES